MLTPLPGPPRRIGPYQLLARVGAGGMGEVHLARRAGPGPGPVELVALKSVREDLDLDDAFRARFRREIAAARAVAGPYTAAVLDADPDAERPWLATEYVAGPSLAGTVARCGPLPVPTVRALGTGLARALSAVHAARLLHRDLKPGNVLLTLEGPRLIDFGIARAFEATQLTAAGAMIGTPGYLAPEQLRGTHALTPASDVFALGAVLAHAAGGHGPFEDVEPAAVIYRTATGDADLDHVPPLLRDVVARCLATDPAHRPSPDEIVRALAAQDGPVWPADVRALFAEHRSAADGFAHAAGQQAFAAAPTAPGAPPGATPRSGRPR
ncbi:protein kinase, partial [Streptomyces sp. SID5785]|uniref:protein kinase domain-containing protein n=1 Tax=Streptomyces sp. SID5785 TaxID=2690309 RepID=UPI0013614467|nr:protein kinase [Streptomyces sp. SID5785]